MALFQFDPPNLQIHGANSAPLELLDGTNVDKYVRTFDNETEEYCYGTIKLPSALDTNGTVTFRAEVMAKVAAASKNIGMTFGHLALNTSEDFDPSSPYTDEDSGAIAIDATQDDVTFISWNETVSNLGWTAGELVTFRLSRDPSVANDLTDDLYLWHFAIDVPTT